LIKGWSLIGINFWTSAVKGWFTSSFVAN